MALVNGGLHCFLATVEPLNYVIDCKTIVTKVEMGHNEQFLLSLYLGILGKFS